MGSEQSINSSVLYIRVYEEIKLTPEYKPKQEVLYKEPIFCFIPEIFKGVRNFARPPNFKDTTNFSIGLA